MQIGKTLSNAWKLIWKNKILWLFGILASFSSLLGAVGGSGGSGGHASSSGGSSWLMPGTKSAGGEMAHAAYRAALNAGSFIEQNPWIIFVFALAVIMFTFVMVIASLFLGALGTSGIIHGVKLNQSRTAEDKPLAFKEVFAALKPVYWRVVLFTLAVSAFKLVVGFILVGLILGITIFTLGIGLILMAPLLLLLIPAGIFLRMLIINALIALVYEDLPMLKAVERAWRVVMANLGEMLLMLLILVVGQFLLTLFIVGPVILSYLPFGLAFLINSQAVMIGVLIMTGLLALVVTLAGILLFGVVTAYVLGAWTINYLHSVDVMTEKETKAQINAETSSPAAT